MRSRLTPGKISAACWPNIHISAGCAATLAILIEPDGSLHIAEEMASRRPVIFVSAHLGNWELSPAVALRLGIPLSVIYSRQQNR